MTTSHTDQASLDTFTLQGVRITSMTVGKLIESLLDAAGQPRQKLFTYVNAHCMNLANRDREYKMALDAFDVVYPDGMSIVWAGRFLGHPVKERLSAADYFIALCEEAARRDISIYLVGGYPDVPGPAVDALLSRIPQLNIAGWRHGFFESDDEERAAVEQINSSGAALLIAGMSVPVQEKWVLRHRAVIKAPAIWCVGALFEYIGGRTPRCPRWMARCGLEWMFRLIVEPRRMWRRYLIGNVMFVWRVLKEKFSRFKNT